MCVYLGCRYFFMSKHTLDGSQVGSALKQMGGKGVTEGMGTYCFVYSGHCGKVLDDIKNHYPCQRPAASYAQEKIGLRTRFYLDMATVHQVEFYLMNRPVGYRNQTLLAALAGNTYEPFVQEKVLHLERTEFRYTQAATVHGLYHGPVALSLFG